MNIRDPITTRDAAALIGVTPRYVRILVERGQLRGEMMGRDLFVSRAQARGIERQRAVKQPRQPFPRDRAS
jgi:excisionase family DNA binding protein